MSYKSARDSRSKRVWVFAILAIVLVLFFARKPIINLFGGAVQGVVAPAWGVTQFLNGEITEGFLFLQPKKALVRRMLELQEDFMNMSSLVYEYEALKKENEDLKESLKLKNTFGFEATARILSRPPQTSYDRIVIDLGQNDDVFEEDLVFVGDNTLLGRVVESYPSSSLVELLSSSGVETEARLLFSELSLPLTGRGGGAFEVAVPRDIPIEELDIFISPYDSGIVLAEVVKVTGDPQDPAKIIVAKTPFNINRVKYVFIKRLQ
jgi:cell shape-determining protein MreC